MLDVITRARLPAGIREANLSMKGRRRDLVNIRTIAVNLDVVTELTGLSVDLDAVVEELFKRLEFLYDTLDDIELVAADDDLLAFVQCAERLEFGLDARSQTVGR